MVTKLDAIMEGLKQMGEKTKMSEVIIQVVAFITGILLYQTYKYYKSYKKNKKLMIKMEMRKIKW